MLIEIEKEKLRDAYIFWERKGMIREVVFEECGELIQALCKKKRKPFNIEVENNVLEEIRDVYISLGILMMDIGVDEEKMNKMIDNKLGTKKE